MIVCSSGEAVSERQGCCLQQVDQVFTVKGQNAGQSVGGNVGSAVARALHQAVRQWLQPEGEPLVKGPAASMPCNGFISAWLLKACAHAGSTCKTHEPFLALTMAGSIKLALQTNTFSSVLSL